MSFSFAAEKEPHKTRKTLLKSSHGHSKHRVQYEFQTFFWTMSLKNMTESTKDTYLEYIQRNLPEGVSMKVTLTELKRLPDNILKTMEWDRFQAKTQLDEENSEAKEDDSNPRLA